MSQLEIHRHFIGAAHSFEIISPKDTTAGQYVRPDVTILKTFFINDKVNVNDWQATWEGLKKDAKDLPGVPLVLQEDLQHPKFSVQELFDRGTIFDYDIDEEKKQIIVYIRITDSKIVERIKSGELQYVSPAVIPRGSEYLKNVNGVDILSRTLPLHLAIVGDPAYGKDAAKMTHLCSGDGKECYHRLKMMTAAAQIYAKSGDLQDCVSRKIPIIKKEKPEISNDQAAAIAYSMCREGTADKTAEITALEQIPFIKKMVASTNRMKSTLLKIKTGSTLYPHEGKMGRWIVAKEMDVFVAENQSIKEAIDNCGCTKSAATEGKISQEKADYHKTSSMEKNCRSCRFYHEDDKYCEVVEGTIEPYFISDLWQKSSK